MAKRLTVAAIAVPILILVVFLGPAWLLGLVVGLAAACCAWEFLRCTEKDAGRRFHIYAAVSAFLIPFLGSFFPWGRIIALMLFLLFAVMFTELMLSFRRETTMEFETVAVVILAGGVFPVLLGSIAQLRWMEYGSVYAFLPFVAAFSSDAGAYFAGIALGKHHLTPRLSPHKTLEGSVGGFLAAIVMMLLYGLVLMAFGYQVKLAVIAVYGFFGSLASQLGDLSFSAVKRLFGVKDYGTLLPGHGGMMDRMDSMFWAAPVIELLCLWAPAITRTMD